MPSQMPLFILGSASPRRYELLARLVPAETIVVSPVDLDEASLIEGWLCQHPGSRLGLSSIWAARIARDLAEAKMAALVQSRVKVQATDQTAENQQESGGTVLVTADTIVVLGDQILGKPVDEADARRMLLSLSGRDHMVLTGLCIRVEINGSLQQLSATEQTQVTFSELTPAQMDWYIQTGEPFDKAGAYGSRATAASWFNPSKAAIYKCCLDCQFTVCWSLEQARAVMFPFVSDSFHLLSW